MMPTINRLFGRFFTVLISLSLAILLPRAMFASEPGPPTLAVSARAGRVEAEPRSPSASIPTSAITTVGGVRADLPQIRKSGASLLGAAGPIFPAWPTERRYTPFRLEHRAAVLVASNPGPSSLTSPAGLPAAALPRASKAPSPTLCQINDTVYRADGTPAQGTVLLSWPSFTTAAGQTVTPGSLLVKLDDNGGFNASLAPNTGAIPAGTYYRAIFKLDDGTNETEFWVVPNTQSTTIGAIRSKLVPANQAAQFLTRDFADSNYLNLTGNETVAGVKTFTASPAVPTPVNGGDAANKSYVDANAGSGNLASPPPIGNVAPNTVNATAMTAQNANGVFSAASYSGSDWTVATNAAIAAAPVGATVDMRGFSPAQLAVAGSQTIALPKQLSLVLPPGVLTLNGCPGINVSAAGVMLQGQSETPYQSAIGTQLKSGTGCPLVANYVNTLHGADGTVLRDLDLYGNSVGTFGFFAPASYDVKLSHVHAHGFTSAGIFAISGRGDFQNVISDTNAGDCWVIGYDGHVSGLSQANGCAADGWHVVTGGTVFSGPTAYLNGLHGMHLDGNLGGNRVASTAYVEPKIIVPSSNNAGAYAFYSQAVGTTASGSGPSFCQSVGCTIQDGTVTWINIGTALGYGISSQFAAQSWTQITAPNISESGNANLAGAWCDISVEGTSSLYAIQDTITDPLIRQTQSGDHAAAGICLNYASQVSIDGYKWYGNSSSGSAQNDLGGLLINNSFFVTVDGMSTTHSFGPAVQITNSGTALFSNSVFHDTGAAGDSIYAVSVASSALNVSFHGMVIDDDRGTPYSKGISNAAAADHKISFLNVNEKGLVSNPDSFGGALVANYILPDTFNLVSNVPAEFDIGGNPALSIDSNAKVTVAGALTFQSVPGVAFLVSKYASMQAAINAAYNNGAVLGTVVDDRTSPYSGPGFILYDSVTLKLAPTTYTLTGTVTYNNGNNNVTAGIVAVPGARLIGASTSSNHGTIITAGNGLNADLIATSTVGTGIGAAAQWWHWGGFENLRVTGNGANQTAGNCFNIENMGETAFLRTIEVSGCKLDNILFTGASATPSDIANITTNSAGRYGFNFNNLSGVAVVHGLSGDSNTTSLVRLNGGQSGTLTILGFKAEEEISGQDPLITIDQSGQNGAQPSLFIVGGYTFGRAGLNDIVKYVNGTAGTAPFVSVSNFYTQDYVNAVNDTVNNRTTAAANMNKVPFYYGPTGAFYSGQAYTLDLNTFVQSPHSGNNILTEVFGTTSSNETLIAASGTSTDPGIGGIGFRMPNRSVYGQTPELFAKMTYAFPGGNPNTQQWEFIPAKIGGDNSTRWIGDPSYRWDEVYASDVNTTTATVGTLNVTTCVGCGPHLVSGTMQGGTTTLTGNGTDQAIYSATLPAGTFAVGTGAHCWAKWQHTTSGSTAITYKWMLGSATVAYGAFTSASVNAISDVEVLTPASLSVQIINASPVIAGTAIQAGPSNGAAGSENLANSDTLKFTFNAGSGEQVKGTSFYCQTVQ